MRAGLRKPVIVGSCLAVAALHLATGPDYRGPFRPFVTGYLLDGALPFALVLLLGVDPQGMPWLRRPLLHAGLVMGIGMVVEASQALGIPLIGRTADPPRSAHVRRRRHGRRGFRTRVPPASGGPGVASPCQSSARDAGARR